jgi:hypothetical protein
MVVQTQFITDDLSIDIIMDKVNKFLINIPWGPISIQYMPLYVPKCVRHQVMIVYNTEPPKEFTATATAFGKIPTVLPKEFTATATAFGKVPTAPESDPR